MPRSVVRNYRVDRAVLYALPESPLVVGRAQRRVHLEARVISAVDDRVLIESEVVECRVAGDVESGALCVADKLHRARA